MIALSKLNFRDIGGVPVRGGKLRKGLIYRSEGPASFEADHRAELAALGFRAVCDLRSTTEQQKAPNDWAQGARLLNFDIITDLRAQNNSGWVSLKENPTLEGARATMSSLYRGIPTALAPRWPHLMKALTAKELPILVHCTAGKDRTGVVIGLLLGLLGASREDIHRDYLLSEAYARRQLKTDSMRERFREAMGYTPDDDTILALLGVDASYLDAALDAVMAQWGSIENYFSDAGIGEDQVAALRGVLVDAE